MFHYYENFHPSPVRTTYEPQNEMPKLTETKVREIHARIAGGEKYGPVAEAYGVSTAAVQQIASGIGWGRLKLPKLTKNRAPETLEPLKDRMARYVEINPTTGCHEWQGAIGTKGYGSVTVDGKARMAHRVAYRLHHGGIPKGLHVCHTCDNRKCVNPAHLFAGTSQQNMDDMVTKGRSARGEKSACGTLTDAIVWAILDARAAGQPPAKIKADFGISGDVYFKIKNGKSWKHVFDAWSYSDL